MAIPWPMEEIRVAASFDTSTGRKAMTETDSSGGGQKKERKKRRKEREGERRGMRELQKQFILNSIRHGEANPGSSVNLNRGGKRFDFGWLEFVAQPGLPRLISPIVTDDA